MIKQDAFQLWRFCTTDGVLDGIKSFNMNETVFDNGSIIRYDPTNEIISIDNHNTVFSKQETLTFRECTLEKLKSLGFKERTTFRHELSYHKFHTPFEK